MDVDSAQSWQVIFSSSGYRFVVQFTKQIQNTGLPTDLTKQWWMSQNSGGCPGQHIILLKSRHPYLDNRIQEHIHRAYEEKLRKKKRERGCNMKSVQHQ